MLPGDAALQAAFEFADALEVLVEPGPILGVGVLFQSLGFVEDEVEHAAAGLDAAQGGGLLLGRAGDEEFAVEPFGAGLRRQDHAGAGHGDGVGVMFALADRYGERSETGVSADLLRDELIERLGVAEGRLARVRRGREEALAGMVVAVHARVGEAGERREARAVRGEQIEVGAGGGAVCGEEILRHHPERDVDGDHPLGRGLFSGLGQRR